MGECQILFMFHLPSTMAAKLTAEAATQNELVVMLNQCNHSIYKIELNPYTLKLFQVDVLTSGGPVQMSGVLYNDSLLFNFMEFVEEQENAGCDRDMLEFWLAASNFRERSTAEHVQGDALIIYHRFISLEATSPLGERRQALLCLTAK